MTNGEKIQSVFSNINFGTLAQNDVIVNKDYSNNDEPQVFIPVKVWNAEYKEPTTKNNKVDCQHTDCNNCVNHKYCDYESTTKNDLGVDAISRADVLKLMQDNWHTHNGDWAMQESMDDIRALPSVTPQEPKTGHWIPYLKEGLIVKCSECKSRYTLGYNFCPNCGADMREVVEE